LHGRAAAVEELIKQGAAHGAKDNRGGYTPLHLAADAGQCEVISRLFELGADLEAVSTKGWTPLALANMKVSDSYIQCIPLSGHAALDGVVDISFGVVTHPIASKCREGRSCQLYLDMAMHPISAHSGWCPCWVSFSVWDAASQQDAAYSSQKTDHTAAQCKWSGMCNVINAQCLYASADMPLSLSCHGGHLINKCRHV